jgi:hypothetical protein
LVIALERLDEIQCGRGEPVSSDELIELAQAHRLVQRLRRRLTSLLPTIDRLLVECDDIAPPTTPEPVTIVDPVIADEEVEAL